MATTARRKRAVRATKKTSSVAPNLTAERIRDQALRLIDQDGLDDFSTRKLGRALGVEAMAIYWYYPSKDSLLDAVVEALVAKIASNADADDFIDALRRLAHAYRGLAHEHPNAFPLLALRRFATPGTFRFLDGLFALAEAHGLDARTTARFYRLVASYCSGVALNELATLRDRAGTAREDVPRVARVFKWLDPEHFDDTFSFGLELLLASIPRKKRHR